MENVTLPKTFSCNFDDEIGRGTDELDLIIQELYGLNGGNCALMAPESDNASVTCGVDDADLQYIIVNAPFNGTATVTGKYYDSGFIDYTLEISFAEPSIDVKWDAATKTGTFTMPAFDVEIAPIYAPVAKWATEGDAVLAPTAIEGIIAGTEGAIVNAGTVAKTGDNVQGTAMYFATTDAEMTAEKAAAANGWLATVPTAAGYDDATTVYVWYYIKGADTPDGQEATAENTFNDLEICATPLKVEVLSNKFDIQFNAANDNTIEAGKATVTVGGTAATVTEGKLTGVKMGSEVKVKAKDGYKFHKVEVKKGGLKTITIGGEVVLVYEDGDTWEKIKDRNPDKVAWDDEDYIKVTNRYIRLEGGEHDVMKADVIVSNGTYKFAAI